MPDAAHPVLFAHRELPDADIYFVDNRSDQGTAIDASFRVAGKEAELWHAETGKGEPASYTIAEGARRCRSNWSRGARCLLCSASLRRRCRERFPSLPRRS
jgi:hypothetical protein